MHSASARSRFRCLALAIISSGRCPLQGTRTVDKSESGRERSPITDRGTWNLDGLSPGPLNNVAWLFICCHRYRQGLRNVKKKSHLAAAAKGQLIT